MSWRFPLLFLLGANALCVPIVLVTHPGRTTAIVSLVFVNAAVFLWCATFWAAYHFSFVRLDRRSLQLPSRRPIPLDAIRDARIVDGGELRRIRRELTSRVGPGPEGAVAAAPGIGLAGVSLGQVSMLARMRNDPNLKGLVAPVGARTAIYFETDGEAGPTRRWLVGTRHAEEFMRALDRALAAKSP
jgi:hypothetical protein